LLRGILFLIKCSCIGHPKLNGNVGFYQPVQLKNSGIQGGCSWWKLFGEAYAGNRKHDGVGQQNAGFVEIINCCCQLRDALLDPVGSPLVNAMFEFHEVNLLIANKRAIVAGSVGR